MRELIKQFNSVWNYKDTMSEDFLVEDTGNCYRVIIKNMCEWHRTNGGCSMCNYSSITSICATEVIKRNQNEILAQLVSFKKSYKKIKLYINGSFFNHNELDSNIAVNFLIKIKNVLNLAEVSVETRPEFVTRNALEDMIDKTLLSFELCFGIESTNSEIRNKCINKGVDIKAFYNMVDSIKNICNIKVYLLIKPPFLTEKLAIEDVVSSVNDLINHEIYCISYTPIAVQSNTILEYLLQEKLYRPVWIWSLIEINTRLKKIKEKYDQVHLSGLDYYPLPISTAFNCEKCSHDLLSFLMRNRDLTWEDLNKSNFSKCNCLDNWHKELQKIDKTIDEQLALSKDIFSHNIRRTDEIWKRTGVEKTTQYLSDIAKKMPVNPICLDQVGIEDIKLPISVRGFRDSIANWSCSIELDEFHRGIHMSRLVECLNDFSEKEHIEIIADIELVLSHITEFCESSTAQITITCDLHKEVSTPITRRKILTAFSFVVNAKLVNNQYKKKVTIGVPFINACPCTLVTASEIYAQNFTHTQRGTIYITFEDTNTSASVMFDFIDRYVSIYDMLKREDELYVVKSAIDNAQFCEDICRDVVKSAMDNFYDKSGKILIRVVTEESIHPHSAFAQKEIVL